MFPHCDLTVLFSCYVNCGSKHSPCLAAVSRVTTVHSACRAFLRIFLRLRKKKSTKIYHTPLCYSHLRAIGGIVLRRYRSFVQEARLNDAAIQWWPADELTQSISWLGRGASFLFLVLEILRRRVLASYTPLCSPSFVNNLQAVTTSRFNCQAFFFLFIKHSLSHICSRSLFFLVIHDPSTKSTARLGRNLVSAGMERLAATATTRSSRASFREWLC